MKTGTQFVDHDASGYVVPEEQQAVFELMRDPQSYDPPPDTVEIISTHGAFIFLAGPYAFKLKRSVRYSYLDYSTLEQRRRMCLKELERNQPSAPEIYRGIVPITKSELGKLSIGGSGTPVEWAIHMNRFDQDSLLSNVIEAGELTAELADSTAQAISRYHRGAKHNHSADSVRQFETVIGDLSVVFEDHVTKLKAENVRKFRDRATERLRDVVLCMRMRGKRGFVRLCHGDLHSENIVLVNSQPVLFDSIEFNDAIATVDVLYDLAFLLMDLIKKGERRAANRILNRYLNDSRSSEDIYGLRAMPLYLACRAGIRAMVAFQRADMSASGERAAATGIATDYFHTALDFLNPAAPQLIAIGGFSGTGKTTLAAALAPKLGSAPGALHLRSDIERKVMFDVPETERLQEEFYSESISAKVYDCLLQKTWIALRTGSTVIVDAVFSKQSERNAFEEVATRLKVPFKGFWLSSSEAKMFNRVSVRRGDASDATPRIVEMQIDRGTGPISWAPIDSSGNIVDTVGQLVSHLGT